MTVRKIIALTIDKKLVFLVIAVSLIGIGLTVFLSFHYSKVILGERATYQLIGEAAIRGGTIERVFNTKMQEIQVITTNPMIRSVVSELNQIQDKKILIETGWHIIIIRYYNISRIFSRHIYYKNKK